VAAEILDRYENKGVTWPFRCSRKGEVITSQSGAVFRNEFTQMATVIFETIGAIGDVKVDRMEIVGEKMGIIMELDRDGLIGSLFKRTPETSKSELWRLIDELKQQGPLPAEQKKIETPGVRARVKVDKHIFDDMKERVKEYLGDFTERIFKNQLKAQKIDLDDLYDEDVRRFILALGKAAGMIIGPSKGHEMTNRLMTLLK
jgi:hypothetical protein